MSLETSCPEHIRLERFAHGQAPAREAAVLAEHIQYCPHCRAALLVIQGAFANGRTLPDAPPGKATSDNDAKTLPIDDTSQVEEASKPPQTDATLPFDASTSSGTLHIPVAQEVSAADASAGLELTSHFDKCDGFDKTGRLDKTGKFEKTAADDATAGAARPGAPALDHVVIPGYEILEELGRGGMGVVYKAHHLRLHRLVALKMILAGPHAAKAGLARFKAEAEVVAHLQHPNIVQIYETGEHAGRLYFSLEYVDGGSLDQHMRDSPTTPRAAAELLEILARAMEVAHQRGIVHRDLKPGNILLAAGASHSSISSVRKSTGSVTLSTEHGHRTAEFYPKIADFGLAKRVDDESSQTQTGTVIGTPSYMSPEQAAGKTHEIGPAADIYSLGNIFYALMVGRPPFKAENPIDTIRQVIEQEPVPLRQLEPRVPRDLETICLKCLEKAPSRRYATAAALADDLRRFLDDVPILARPTPAWERAWKWGRRRPAVVALLGVSVLAVVAMVTLIAWHNISLRGQLDEARAEEREARAREQRVLDEQRLARLENEGQKLFEDARLAVAARDWPAARVHLTKVLTSIDNEPRLEALKAPAQGLMKQVEGELRSDTERRDSQSRLKQFAELRDEAQFLGTLYTGMDLAANLKATRDTVLQALAVYGVAPSKVAKLVVDAHLSDAQRAEIREDCHQLFLILAEAHAQDQQLADALRCLEQALCFAGASRAYHLRRARYLGLQNDRDGQAQAEKAAQRTTVANVLDHFLVADEYYRREQYDEALRKFHQVLERKPAHFWAQYMGALCNLRQGRHAEARAQLTGCLAQRAEYVWLYLFRGYANTELQAYVAADADYAKALQFSRDDYARYALYVNRGVLRVRQERYGDAVADLKTAIGIKPQEHSAFINLALAYRGMKNLDLALEQLDRACALEPALARGYRLRARLHLERKEPALALKDFDSAIEHENRSSPFRADDLVERGRLLLRDRKPAPALGSFDAALAVRKDHSLGQRLRAEALFQLGKYQDVVETLDRYLETGKPLESVYRGRGLARAELGKFPGAIEDYTRAIELEPTSAVHTYRGWAHLVCEAPMLALRDFKLAIQLDAANADAYSGRGFVVAQQGQHAEALRDAADALRHGPSSPRLLYNVARIHAQCPGEANELRAIELITQALGGMAKDQRAGFWTTHVRPDAALQSLRRHERYLQLDAQLSARK